MNWEQRLRDLLMAGGAVAAVACSSGPASGPQGGGPCCNASSDPCCDYRYCGGPLTAACECTLDGGTWNYSGSSSGGSCGPAQEAGSLTDAGGGDGPTQD